METVKCEIPEQEHFDGAAESVRLGIIYRAIRRIEEAIERAAALACLPPVAGERSKSGVEVDIANKQLVQLLALRGEYVVVLSPINVMTKDEAMVHAAWLISIAGDDSRFVEILQKVRNT